ncbi:hypothetical protein B0H10DRAFT_2436371 [Mycena sp. CBHHK59/15]|nr:hypothetical protein B0H10DRAFT_2436371 [Mycena sp. CBHHK59/15]
MSAGEDIGAACCGLCCLCGFSALSTWCDQNAFGGRGGRGTGCCGSCCSKSFNEDSMDKWDKDKARLRTEKSQPAPSEPMRIPASTEITPLTVSTRQRHQPRSQPPLHIQSDLALHCITIGHS